MYCIESTQPENLPLERMQRRVEAGEGRVPEEVVEVVRHQVDEVQETEKCWFNAKTLSSILIELGHVVAFVNDCVRRRYCRSQQHSLRF